MPVISTHFKVLKNSFNHVSGWQVIHSVKENVEDSKRVIQGSKWKTPKHRRLTNSQTFCLWMTIYYFQMFSTNWTTQDYPSCVSLISYRQRKTARQWRTTHSRE